MKPDMREHGHLEHHNVRHNIILFVTLVLALLFLLSPPWIQHAAGTGYPYAAGFTIPYASHSASFLLNGKSSRSQEIDNGPLSGRFTAASSVSSIHVANARLPVLGGRALVAGWVINRRLSASAELYDVSTNSWFEAGSLSNSIDNRNSIFPRSSRVFVWGGIIVPF